VSSIDHAPKEAEPDREKLIGSQQVSEKEHPPAKCAWRGGELEVRVWGAQEEVRERVTVTDIERSAGKAATSGSGSESFMTYVMRITWKHPALAQIPPSPDVAAGGSSREPEAASSRSRAQSTSTSKPFRSFMISHRYSEFETLRADLTAALQNSQEAHNQFFGNLFGAWLPALPGKTMFVDGKDPAVVQARRLGLQQFLRDTMKQFPTAINMDCFIRFLSLESRLAEALSEVALQ